ncbi:hypothetical protein ACQ4PT_025728 [Festuca glaucescens]
MDVPNENISAMASNPSAATAWVKDNVRPYPGVSFTPSGFQPGTTVSDVGNGLKYTSLFDAIYAALEHSGRPGVEVVVSETRLLSSGTSAANVQNARTYNQNLINHVGQGTPKSSRPLETYMFAMFKENLKKGDETERHFGLFNPDKSPAYTLSF